MAYGGSELDLVATTTDQWMTDNAIDLLSGQNAFFAVTLGRSQEPGGDFSFKVDTDGNGLHFKYTVFGSSNSTVAGVTRANQINAISPTISANVATNAIYNWSHYQGLVTIDYSGTKQNAGSSKKVDWAESIVGQIKSTFFDLVGTHIWDGTTGAEDHIQSVKQLFSSPTATVGAIDASQAENTWWRSQSDSTVEVFNFQTFDQVRDSCTFDTGTVTGIVKPDPDVAFMYTDLYSKARQDLRPAQRVEITDTLKGGAKYLFYDGLRLYRETKMSSGECAIINSSTVQVRVASMMPEPNAPGFIQDPTRPSIKTRGYNWWLGIGCKSRKHNGYLSNKTAS